MKATNCGEGRSTSAATGHCLHMRSSRNRGLPVVKGVVERFRTIRMPESGALLKDSALNSSAAAESIPSSDTIR